MKTLWAFIIKYEFWFFVLIFIGLAIGEYKAGGGWMGGLANLVVLVAIMRLSSHPMWKKDEEKGG